MKIQWDVVWSVLRTLLVAGGPVGTLLIACGFPAVQVSTWLGIGLGVVGVLSVAVPGLVGALKQTNSGKVANVATLPMESKAAVAASLPSEITLAAVNDLPDVKQVVVSKSASDGVATAAANPMLDKVVTEKH